ncbi:methylmalonyl-CoA epimerase [Lottiidibacillus patelloidae]|uniref:Methylmalonyl-CoA epimerase n=1 Tax=Lottiidibacillus patelloidae TaxID=2670334 RepID=A0A263BVJ9_9BACI|nr:methylmalonyl-CoA epimerase [Lottiidibacillus patelloidae]OZM57598.1 methylmalonyl-CoA epimerase [Lottiidibacillus patelloidae]
MPKKIRVLVAKPGLDGHDRGALIIAQSLRDSGMEVIYTGLRQTPEQIVASAIQEDVDVIGLSCLSGAHNELFPEVVRLLEERDASDIIVIGGGVIPWEDIPFLEEKGIRKVFTPGTPTDEIAVYINGLYNKSESHWEEPKKIDHIGIAVKSIEEALPFYVNTLKLKLEQIEEVTSEQVKVAFLRIGESRLELLEPLSQESPIATFIEKRGEGIHHVALGVDQIEDRIAYLKESGINMIHDEPKIGAGGANIAFLHPKSSGGVLYELCEKSGKKEEN